MRTATPAASSHRLCAALCALLVGALPWGRPAWAEEPPRAASFYVDAALAGNPSLGAMQARIRMKENAALRAGALDDPKVRVGVTNVPVDTWSFRDEDMTGKELGLSQMVPYPGKLKLRTDIATRDKEQTEFDLREMRARMRAEVKMTYAELSAVRKQADTVRRSREVLRDIVRVAEEMYTVGKGIQADVHRGQVEFDRMRDMLLMLENREKVLSIRLNTLAGLSPEEPVSPLDDLPELAVPRRREELMDRYRESRPARMALQARILRAEAQVAMAKREYYPDFELSVSYMQRDRMPDGASRPDMFSSMVMMNLPIWRRDKLDPAVREMQAEREMAVRELAGMDLEAANAIGGSLATLENRASTAILYRTTLIPHLEQSFQANVEGYRVGKVDFPMLMDSVMGILAFRKEYLGMVAEQHMEKARLEAAVGRELD